MKPGITAIGAHLGGVQALALGHAPEGREPGNDRAHAVQLVGLAGARLPVEEGNGARVVGHVLLHRRLHEAAGDGRVDGVAAVLQHSEHRLGDDRMLACTDRALARRGLFGPDARDAHATAAGTRR